MDPILAHRAARLIGDLGRLERKIWLKLCVVSAKWSKVVESMIQLPDVRALIELPFDGEVKKLTGIGILPRPVAQRQFDKTGLWWAVPFALGASGSDYAFRLSPGSGHGAVLRCLNGHAVTIASSPERAIFAILAVERLLAGEKSRARLQDNWARVRELLRDAVAITGGDPDMLESVLHMADHLPKWISPAPANEEDERRRRLRDIAHEELVESPGSAWSRANDSRAAPGDAEACLRLLQGNHGLDGTRNGGGLMPGAPAARELLVACAQQVRAAGLSPDEHWVAVVEALADRQQPEAKDFIAASVGVGATEAWHALGAASFWFNAVGGEVPEEHASVAEEIAEAAGASHILEARRLLR